MDALRIKAIAVAVAAVVCIGLAAGAVTYHFATVVGLERKLATATKEAQDAKDAHNGFIADLLRKTTNAFKDNAASVAKAMQAREAAHEAVRQEGTIVNDAIATEASAPDGPDLDLPLPDAVSAGLVRLYESANTGGSGSGAAVPSRGAVQPQTHAAPAKEVDGQKSGGVDGGALGLVR